ncbi:MAG: pyrroline-5-carboxylate reductase [Deltaproteobacteria bacterium]|nr:MAG: pyrroline-5-carboxylate reductase [Deltaproteobacteria bacterium]
MLDSKKVGFIGGGNMGEALIKGLLGSGRLDAQQILVSDISQDRRHYLQGTYQLSTFGDNGEVAGSSDVIVLAVKPQQMANVLADISARIEHLPLVISIAAGVTIATLERGLGKPAPVTRVMPNTPALILTGASAIAGGTHANSDHIAMTRMLFEAVGLVVEVDEAHMDAVTGLSGSGPAYVYLFIESLIDAGVSMGLSRPVARDLAVQTTLGAAKLAADSESHLAALKDQITSPGGTTIEGLAVLERQGMRGILMDAVAAATRRSKELGQK